MIRDEPAVPVYWGAEQKGMQSGAELDPESALAAQRLWSKARLDACDTAEELAALGLHKSLINRRLEADAHMTAIFTMTEHRNFFGLRAHPAAMPELQVLAYMALRQYRSHIPVEKDYGEWHIPQFPNAPQIEARNEREMLAIATARCARLSFLTFDGLHSPEADLALHDRLVGPPFHASPFEHCAQAISKYRLFGFKHYPYSNFDYVDIAEGETMPIRESGWGQYRKLFTGESGTRHDLDAIAATEPAWVTQLINHTYA